MSKKFMYYGFFIAFLFSCKKNELSTTASLQNSKKVQYIYLCTTDQYSQNQKGITTSAIGGRNDFWPTDPNYNPLILRVKFIDSKSSDFFRNKIKTYVKEWEECANIKYVFVGNNEHAEIRIKTKIGEDEYDNSWTLTGYLAHQNTLDTESTMDFTFKGSPETMPTNILKYFILHEFGHVLGLSHEHAHPNHNIQWSKAAFPDGTPKPESASESTYSKYDSESIMHYAIPAQYIANGKGIDRNYELSAMDKRFIQEMYPFSPAVTTQINEDIQDQNMVAKFYKNLGLFNITEADLLDEAPIKIFENGKEKNK